MKEIDGIKPISVLILLCLILWGLMNVILSAIGPMDANMVSSWRYWVYGMFCYSAGFMGSY